MKILTTRTRLLGGAALGLSLLAIASPASAACPAGTTVNLNDSRICVANVTTTDTTGVVATDRNAQFFAGGVPTYLTVNTGEIGRASCRERV